MKVVVFAVGSLFAQYALGFPGAPSWFVAPLLPMVFIVGPTLRLTERRWPHYALLLGLGWDLIFEPVIGPGAIAWSAAAVVVGALVPLVADRSSRAWFVFGALGAYVMVTMRHLALIPLGLSFDLTWTYVVLTIVLTASWCGLVGWLLALDVPQRWRLFRARKLR
jgi:hypothetical protein